MKKAIYIIVTGLTALLLSGCGVNQPRVAIDRNTDESTFRIHETFPAPEVDKRKYDTDEKHSTCTRHFILYGAAKETLANGYKRFALADDGWHGNQYDNNMQGLAINTYDAWDRYCNPGLYDPDTGLEDDKCQFHKLLGSITPGMGGKFLMLREPTYLFPTWDAEKVLEQERVAVNECIDWSQYSEASSVDDIEFKY